MTGPEKNRFYRIVAAMEEEDDLAPVPQPLEDRLVGSMLGEIGAQRARRRRRWLAGGASVALAACLMLIMVWAARPGLPAYEIHVDSDAQMLGSPAAVKPAAVTLTPDSVLRVTLVPRERVAGPVRVEAFVRQDGVLRPFQVEFQQETTGVFRLRAPLRELFAPRTGAYELVFAIGRPGGAPSAAEVEDWLRRPAGDRTDRWQMLREHIEIRAP